jgi:hypothetical protein
MTRGDILERSNAAAELGLLKAALGQIWRVVGTADGEGNPRPKRELCAAEIENVWQVALGALSVHTDDGREEEGLVLPEKQPAAIMLTTICRQHNISAEVALLLLALMIEAGGNIKTVIRARALAARFREMSDRAGLTSASAEQSPIWKC